MFLFNNVNGVFIDTASVYRNEEAIGRVLQCVFEDADSFNGLKRSDIFITTKLAPRDQGYEACLKAFETSRQKLGVEYIDLYLIHWPGTQKLKTDDPRNAENRMGSYRALEELYREGKIRAIGVSNYTIRHLKQLLDDTNISIQPSVLQTELHPLWPDRELVAFCRKHNIQLEAYSSLGEGALVNGTYPLPAVTRAVTQLNQRNSNSSSNSNNSENGQSLITDAQVLLRWAIQRQFVVIPKSTNPKRITENMLFLIRH
ncbi:NADP-dependent oxidoreductase domain-containing protein [Syncephalis fuscata]|nr:NADP-dependent oxidoreductase domain-containing protein [Syncephalis fuscata]